MAPLSPNFDPDGRPSAVSRMLDLVQQSGRDASDLVYLVRGEPDFITPLHIRRALTQAVEDGYTHYPPSEGFPELREAVARRLETDYQLAVEPDEVLITCGATMGMYIALQALTETGHEVILPEPIYDVYHGQIESVGAKPIPVVAHENDGHFHIPVQALNEALTRRTQAIILNTPWNPTGTVMSESELREIGEFALEHNLFILVDEIYEKLIYDGYAHHHLAALSNDFRQITVSINSFSKTYAMTGWRLGYNIASPALIRAMHNCYCQCSRGSSAFVQRAGLAALLGPQEPVQAMVAEYAHRRNLVVQSIQAIDGLHCLAPEGTFFCLIDMRAYNRASEEMARHLLKECGLVTVPGAYYGPSLEGFLRISFSYASEDIMNGLERLADGIRRL